MGGIPRHILMRVVVGLLIGIAMFHYREAMAQSCPSGQRVIYTSATIQNNSGLNTAPYPCGPVGTNGKRGYDQSEFFACFRPSGTRSVNAAGNGAELGTPQLQPGSATVINQPRYTVSNGVTTTTLVGNDTMTLTATCSQPICPPGGTAYGMLTAPDFGSRGNFCDTVVYPSCEVKSEPFLRISGAGLTPTGGTGYDITYTGAACVSTLPPAPAQADSGDIQAGPETFKLTRGGFSVVEWVNANVKVPSTVPDTNRSTAYRNDAVVRNNTSPADAPNGGAEPIVVTFIRDGQRITQIFPPSALVNSTNLTNVRNQSGGPAGGSKPPGTNTTVTSTVRNGDGSTTTTTTVYNATTNTTTVNVTTQPPPGSPPGTPPTTQQTSQTRPNQAGESSTQSTANRTNASGPSGGGGGGGPAGGPSGGGPTGDEGGSGSGDEGEGEGDCTGDECGEGGGGGGDGAFKGKGGTARTFGESIGAVTTAWEQSAAMAKLNSLTISGGGSCPAPNIALPYLNQSITMDAHCTVAAGIRNELRAVFLAIWLIIAVGTFLRP